MLLGAVTGLIAGLAAITPASGDVGPLGALVIGTASAVICQYASTKIKMRFAYDSLMLLVYTVLVDWLEHYWSQYLLLVHLEAKKDTRLQYSRSTMGSICVFWYYHRIYARLIRWDSIRGSRDLWWSACR